MLGILSIVGALALLIYFAYRGISVVIIAPLVASLAVLLAGETLILGAYTQVFMKATGNFIILYFPLFLLGAIFGKLMDDSGSAQAIAQWAVKKFGQERSMLVVVLSCALLTYGGVSLFVVAFAIVPIAEMLFRNNGLPKRLIPGAVALGAFSFTMTALPGTPAIQNAIPMPFFGTTPFAAPILGIIAAGIMLILGMLWLNGRARAAVTQGEAYGAHADVAPRVDKKLRVHSEGDGFDIGELCDKPVPAGEPGILTAVSPIVLVIALNYVFSKYILPALDTSFLALPQYGKTDLAAVQGIWSIIAALAGSILLVMVLNRRRFSDFTNSLDSGANASVMPIFNTASLVGFGAVIATLPSFATIAAGIFRLGGNNPLISLALSVSVLAGITGSASGGMSIVLQSMGAKFTEMALFSGVSLDLMHRVTALAAGGLDCLPHGGAVITLLQICNLSHRDSYLDICAVSVAGPVIALIAVIILGTLFGSF
jgi:H+/gluconate symporter-like permease